MLQFKVSVIVWPYASFTYGPKKQTSLELHTLFRQKSGQSCCWKIKNNRCQVLHAVSYKLPTQYTEQCLYKGGWVVNTFTTRFALVVRYDGFGHTLLFSEEKKYFSFTIWTFFYIFKQSSSFKRRQVSLQTFLKQWRVGQTTVL